MGLNLTILPPHPASCRYALSGRVGDIGVVVRPRRGRPTAATGTAPVVTSLSAGVLAGRARSALLELLCVAAAFGRRGASAASVTTTVFPASQGVRRDGPAGVTVATVSRTSGSAAPWTSTTAPSRLGTRSPTRPSTTACSPNGERRPEALSGRHALSPARSSVSASSPGLAPPAKPWAAAVDPDSENRLTLSGGHGLTVVQPMPRSRRGEDIDDCRCGGHCPQPEERRSHPRGRRLTFTFLLRARARGAGATL